MRYHKALQLSIRLLKYFSLIVIGYLLIDFFKNNFKIDTNERYLKRIILGAIILSIIFMYLNKIKREK